MASISSSTMHTVGVKKSRTKSKPAIGSGTGKKGIKKATTIKRSESTASKSSQGKAPKMTPNQLNHPTKISALQDMDMEMAKQKVLDYTRSAFGESKSLFKSGIASPRTESATRDRISSAADVAIAAKVLGSVKVLKTFGVLELVERMLIPNGIGAVFANADGTTNDGGMKKIASSISLASMMSKESQSTAGDSFATGLTDSKRGKQTPPEAREGGLLILRALCELVGKKSEPFVVPLLASALDECCSSNSSVRTAAEDTSKAIIALANPLATSHLICPVLFAAMKSSEWRVKVNALDCLSQLALTAPKQVSKMLPQIIPAVTGTVWDTKPQVTKAAKNCLHVTCETNLNPDVKPAIPAVVNAIVKPADTVKAVEELMATTFVATVDASTLAILCPILSRGLKDKLAINKRACCLVIQNMSRLVETPEAVAPFGPLLVPDLKKVAENVQFEEIRDTALAALATLTKALGHGSIEEAYSTIMEEETRKVLEEQQRIQEERDAAVAREEAARLKEEEERKLWKEAMDAQRKLEQIALKEEEEKKAEDFRKRERQKTKVKTAGGKCQGCGLKKCKKTCLFA